ncbi:hypothetical protein Tco_0253124 [Tanacetum coccineum]
MVEEVKTKMGELFGTYKEMFDFLSSNSSMGEHMESEVTSPNNGDNDFLNDYYNVDATSSYETETELDRYLREPKIELHKDCYANIELVTMSSPNHPTSNIEDAFSSNFPDYISVSLDYVLASPGKTYSSSLNNSFDLVPIASPTFLLFHDDPYMKVMHAYYAKESPIPPPTIMPPYSMLSPMFNPQEFFLPKELLPLKKRGRDRSSSSTSALPQEFEIGESSRKTSLERYEEQIKEILNHLDKLSLDRIENIEDKIKDIQVRHQEDKESPLNAIYELKNSQARPSDY